MANVIVRCPFCNSPEVFRFCRDADYGGGSYYDPVNSASCYKTMPREDFRPDVSLYHCGSCDMFFEPRTAVTEKTD